MQSAGTVGTPSTSAPPVGIITYCLSETGRRASLRRGGSASYHQNIAGPIEPYDMRLFHCSSGGVLSVVVNQVEFDGPQSFIDLLVYVRQRRQRLSAIRTLMEAEAIAAIASTR
jgi:hypothetical protein